MVEVTSRTIGGRFLLRPEPRLNERVVGVLARAQQYTDIEIYGVNFQSSHPHLDVGVEDSEQLAAFFCYAQGNIAKEVNRLQGWSDNRLAWIVVLAVLMFTRLGRLQPWTFWESPVAMRPPDALVAFHNPDNWTDRLLRTGQAAYLQSLVVPELGTTARVIEFLRARAAPGDIVVTNAGWESLYFHTRLPMGMTVLPTYPIFGAARAHGVPDYVFTAGGARWLVWRQAWGRYRGQAIDRVLQELAAANVPVEQVATLPETLWENRENVLYRRFAGGRYIFPWYEGLPPTIIYRIDWHRAGQGGS
jgi:hypothetical protein